MDVEWWKSFFEIGGVALLFLTFAFGAGFMITGKVVNDRQSEQLRKFEANLTGARTELGKQQERAARAERDAADAKSMAANVNDKALRLEAEAARARERAAKAEKEVLELQNAQADRILSDRQVETLASTLSLYAGQEYTVTAYWDSKESLNIANRIHAALLVAHWKYSEEGSKSMMLGGIVGVFVWTHPDADKRTKDAAENLVATLLGEGIQAGQKTQNPVNNPKHNRISLSVGSKR